MSVVGSYEAKTHLARLLERVERGETVTITRHGQAIARLVPVDDPVRPADELIAQLRANRTGLLRGTDTIRSMLDEGRR